MSFSERFGSGGFERPFMADCGPKPEAAEEFDETVALKAAKTITQVAARTPEAPDQQPVLDALPVQGAAMKIAEPTQEQAK